MGTDPILHYRLIVQQEIEFTNPTRELQLVQLDHDRAYHLDVLGLARAEQLRHYAFHAAKLAGAFARRARGEVPDDEIVERRLPDVLLFGIKLPTVMAETLPEGPLDARPAGSAG